MGYQRRTKQPWSNFAILYRTNAQARVVEEAIRSMNIPYRIIGGTRFYDRKEVRDLVAYLRVVANPWDETALRRIINFPARGIGDQTVFKLSAAATEKKTPFFRMVESPSQVDGLSAGVCTLSNLYEMFVEFRQRFAEEDTSYGHLCRQLIARIDFRNAFTRTERDVKRIALRLENLEEMCNALDAYQKRNPDGRLEDFLCAKSLDGNRKEDEEDLDEAVSLMTLHSSKGLEFPVVYLTGFEEGFLPHTRNPTRGSAALPVSPTEIEEERRLVYVGITRAKQKLTLTGAKKRIRFGKTQARKPSRFLYEIPEDLFEGDRSGQVPELTGDALQERGREAFAQMLDWVKTDDE